MENIKKGRIPTAIGNAANSTNYQLQYSITRLILQLSKNLLSDTPSAGQLTDGDILRAYAEALYKSEDLKGRGQILDVDDPEYFLDVLEEKLLDQIIAKLTITDIRERNHLYGT